MGKHINQKDNAIKIKPYANIELENKGFTFNI